MIVRNLLLVVALLVTLTLAVAITDTSTSNRLKINKDGYKKVNAFDARANGKKLKYKGYELASEKDLTDDFEGKKKLLIKIVRPRSSNSFNGDRLSIANEANAKIDERSREQGGRYRRNATSLDEFKGAKKSYKKVKLVKAQSGYKNWKNKEYPDDPDGGRYADKQATKRKNVNRRHASQFVDNKGRSKRYLATRNPKDDKSDYYAQRKAVMDRFYARQREIAEKYARRATTTPKYVHRHDLDKKIERNNATSTSKIERGDVYKTANTLDNANNNLNATTNAPSTTEAVEQVRETTTRINRDNFSGRVQAVENLSVDNNEEDASDDYDYYTLEDNKFKTASDTTLEENENAVLNDNDGATSDGRSDVATWGNCAGKLVYQHNLILNVQKSALADADLTASLEGPFCVTCIRVVPVSRSKASVSFDLSRKDDGTFNYVRIKVQGFQDEEVSYVIKIWAVAKHGDRCD